MAMANRTVVVLSPTSVRSVDDIQKFSTSLSVKQIMVLIKEAESRMEIRAIGGGDGQKMQMLQIEMAGQCD